MGPDNKAYQLSYRENKVHVWQLVGNRSASLLNIVNMPSQNTLREGWGLTYANEKFYATDGSDKIVVIDPVLW